MSEKVTAMIEEIKGLTVLELSELVHALEEEFGVSAAAMAAPATGAAAPAAEEKTDFDVVLAGFDAAAKIKVIKVVREITGQGLAEAKATVEGAPSTLKEAVSKDEAEALKKQIEEVGGKVEEIFNLRRRMVLQRDKVAVAKIHRHLDCSLHEFCIGLWFLLRF